MDTSTIIIRVIECQVRFEFGVALSELRGSWSANGDLCSKEEGSGAKLGVSATISPSPLGRDSAGHKFVFDSSHQCRELGMSRHVLYSRNLGCGKKSTFSRSGQKNGQSFSHAVSLSLKFIHHRCFCSYCGQFVIRYIHAPHHQNLSTQA